MLGLVAFSSYNGTNEEAQTNDIMKSDTTDIQKEIAEGVVAKLQNEITYETNDTLTFFNGILESIDIKSTETAEILFQCIRNCVRIVDLTGAALEPMALPIQINGQGIGTFECIYTDYPETGQFLCIVFSEEDSTAFYEYVMAMETTN